MDIPNQIKNSHNNHMDIRGWINYACTIMDIQNSNYNWYVKKDPFH